MNKVIKQICSSLVTILVVVLVLLSIIISISSITAKANNGVPDLFGYSPFSVQTDSMYPTLSKGDYIFVEKCDTKALEVGDIVTYFTFIEGKRVVNTHRIVDVFKEGDIIEYQTQGDNKQTNPEPDELLLAPGDVIGKYNDSKIPKMGAVIDYLGTRMGFFLVILLPVLLFTLYQIYKLVMIILYNHKVDVVNAANESTSDEVKEAIIAEYLAQQQKKEAEKTEKSEETEDKND
ncbi:MAG: signal peptidase I [Ruminococcaceae bacterium]|nr:signal peptidase I [Oscillospiraceae bacterium]